MKLALAAAFALATTTLAQDPAQGWTAYARALPSSGSKTAKLLHASATWKNLGNAKSSAAFYSPWFGSDTSDNLNLIQPVNRAS
jgi:hypothetical protein